MIDNVYAKAYKEVLEIIKYFPDEEYRKIPTEKIEYYIQNMDPDYEFTIDPDIDLADQNISPEANAIIVNLFTNYYATDEQKSKIEKILNQNEQKKEEEKREKYNPDDIFKKEKQEEIHPEETALVNYKESFFVRFKNFIFRLLHLQ